MKLKETCMPAQETFLDQQIGDKRIEVVKTYDYPPSAGSLR